MDKWVNTGGGMPATKNITTPGCASNGSPNLIRVTVTGHGYSNGDVIQIMAVGGCVEANGNWIISGSYSEYI